MSNHAFKVMSGYLARAIFSSYGPIAEKQILITDAYLIAAKGDLLAFNTKYALPVDWGVIRKVSFYHDVSVLLKHESAFENSVIQTTSVMFLTPSRSGFTST